MTSKLKPDNAVATKMRQYLQMHFDNKSLVCYPNEAVA